MSTLPVRRVVTGHTPDGHATVSIDDTLSGASGRQNVTAAVIWTTEGFPVDNTGGGDTSKRQVGTTLANGTVFRIVEFGPGNAARVHRTDSIDYAVVRSGCAPATSWSSAARSTTGSTAAANPAPSPSS
jgi:hypothetical protein